MPKIDHPLFSFLEHTIHHSDKIQHSVTCSLRLVDAVLRIEGPRRSTKRDALEACGEKVFNELHKINRLQARSNLNSLERSMGRLRV